MYEQFDGMVYQQIVGILMMDTNCDPLIVDLFLYYYERDFRDIEPLEDRRA